MGGLRAPVDRLVAAVMEHSAMDRDQLIEAGRHGADAVWPGFIYNTGAAAFFDRHDELIWEYLVQLTEDLGEPNPAALMASFNRSDMMASYQGFKVLLACFALEEAGRSLDDE